jgi:hypothetical protein
VGQKLLQHLKRAPLEPGSKIPEKKLFCLLLISPVRGDGGADSGQPDTWSFAMEHVGLA